MLSVSDLHVSYGGINAVKGISFDVAEGEMVALIGANGAGKSTTLKAICGLVPSAGGRVEFRGENITGTPSFQLVRQGLALVPEGRGIFSRLTVAENLAMGAYARDDKRAIAADLERIYGFFERLHERREQKAGTLSGGEQQMLAIGRALMARPRLLLLDEPSMGLAPMMVEKIFAVIRRIAAEGVTLLLVEQNARLALQASQRGYVLDSGRIILGDESAKLLNDPQVREAYLGE